MIDISLLDIILLNITTFLLGIATGVSISIKYKISKSKSTDNLSKNNHQHLLYPPNATVSPVCVAASAPPATNPLKLTIE